MLLGLFLILVIWSGPILSQSTVVPIKQHGTDGTVVNVFGGNVPQSALRGDHAKSMEGVDGVISDTVKSSQKAARHAEETNRAITEENEDVATTEAAELADNMHKHAEDREALTDAEKRQLDKEEQHHEKVMNQLHQRENNDEADFEAKAAELRGEAHELEVDMKHKEGVLKEEEDELQDVFDSSAEKLSDERHKTSAEVAKVKRLAKLRGAEEEAHEAKLVSKREATKPKPVAKKPPGKRHEATKGATTEATKGAATGDVAIACVPLSIPTGGTPCGKIDGCSSP